jgi:hypothetical protein
MSYLNNQEIFHGKIKCLIGAVKESWLPLIGIPIFFLPAGGLFFWGYVNNEIGVSIIGSSFVIGVVFSAYFFWGMFKEQYGILEIATFGVKETGKVLSVKSETDSSTEQIFEPDTKIVKTTHEHIFYTIVFEYTFENRIYTGEYMLMKRKNPGKLSPGDPVPIIILSFDPKRAIVNEKRLGSRDNLKTRKPLTG